MTGMRFCSRVWIFMVFCLVLQGCRPPDQQQRRRALDKPGDLILDIGEDVKMRFVNIEALGFFVGKYEVTNAEYRLFRPDHSSGSYKEHSLDGDEQPVVNVSWKDAHAFCEWLNDKFDVVDGKKLLFRLPAVEEWETFARCGDDREFPWGHEWPPPENWNYYGQENPEPGPKLETDDGYQVSCPVDESGMNEWRLFGVGGNVWQWCELTEDADGETQSFKGASWVDYHPRFLKVEQSRIYPPDYRAVNMGFRVVVETEDAVHEPEAAEEEEEKEEQ